MPTTDSEKSRPGEMTWSWIVHRRGMLRLGTRMRATDTRRGGDTRPMANRRLSMRTLKEVLRLHGEAGLGVRAVARSCGLSHSTVSEVLMRAEQAGLRWPLSADVEESVLLARLYPDKQGRPRLQPE